MRSTLVITVLVCLAMSLQATNSNVVPAEHFSRRELHLSRSFNLTPEYKSARRLGITLPKQICPPAHDAGTFIVEQAINCAMQFLMPGSGMVSQAVKVGKAVAGKLGLMAKLEAMKHKASSFIIGKLLGLLGCKVRRNLNIFGAIGNVVKKAGKSVNKAAAGVANAAKKAASAVAAEAKKAAAGVANATKNIASGVAKAAKDTAAFAKKYSAIIGPVVCLVLAKVCKPACTAAVTAFKSVGVMINATFHIPVGCLCDALGAGCIKLCDVVCKKRRLVVRRRLIAPKNRNSSKENIPSEKKRFDNFTAAANPSKAKNEFNNAQKIERRRMVLPKNERENKKGQLKTWKAKLDGDEKKAYQGKNKFENGNAED